MDDQHNEIMAYVLDEPEDAAREIAQLRKDVIRLRDEAEDNEKAPGWCIFCSLVALIVGALFL
jgi:hypothetical protein